MRAIHISNEKKRDAQVGFEAQSADVKLFFLTPEGGRTFNERYVKFTMDTSAEVLEEKYGDLTDDIIAGDPEIDFEKVGKKLSELKKVYLTSNGQVAYGDCAAVQYLLSKKVLCWEFPGSLEVRIWQSLLCPGFNS